MSWTDRAEAMSEFGEGSGGQVRSVNAPWWQVWNLGKKEKWYDPNQWAYYMQMGVPKEWQGIASSAQDYWGGQAAYLAQLRAGEQARAQQESAAALMGQRAQGQALVSQAEAQRQLALGQGAIASRAATSMRGSYDPATARAAMYATGQLGGDVAGQAAQAAAQEQMAAAQAANAAYAQMQGMDVDQMIRMMQLSQNARQYGQQVMMGYQNMGLQDKAAELQSSIAYEQAKQAGWMNKEVSAGVGPALMAGLGAVGAGALTGWNPSAMAAGAQGFGSLGAGMSNW